MKNAFMSGLGTVAYSPFAPPRPNFDDVIDIYYSAHQPSEREWVIGRATWIHLLKLKDANGRYMVPATFVDEPLSLMGRPVRITDDEPNALRFALPGDSAATGATERLHALCHSCDTELPPGAAYCIKCGHPVEQER